MFASREEVGIVLGEYLMGKDVDDTVVVGIPRGGVMVGIRVSHMLHLPFDIVLVKKITSPTNLEFAIGAAGEGGEVYWDEAAVKGMSEWDRKEAVKEALQLVNKRKNLVRPVFPEKDLEGKDIILVDDGVATGATVMCALTVLQGKGARNITLAVPVIAKDVYKELRKHVASIYALQTPLFFTSVGQVYENFPQVTDEEMIVLLKQTER